MKRYMIAAVMLAALAPAIFADEDAEPKLSVRPTGRILLDGAYYMGGNGDWTEGSADKKFVSGVAIPDVRIGVKASYGK